MSTHNIGFGRKRADLVCRHSLFSGALVLGPTLGAEVQEVQSCLMNMCVCVCVWGGGGGGKATRDSFEKPNYTLES